jgi:hypothetical protein
MQQKIDGAESRVHIRAPISIKPPASGPLNQAKHWKNKIMKNRDLMVAFLYK